MEFIRKSIIHNFNTLNIDQHKNVKYYLFIFKIFKLYLMVSLKVVTANTYNIFNYAGTN